MSQKGPDNAGNKIFAPCSAARGLCEAAGSVDGFGQGHLVVLGASGVKPSQVSLGSSQALEMIWISPSTRREVQGIEEDKTLFHPCFPTPIPAKFAIKPRLPETSFLFPNHLSICPLYIGRFWY